MHARLFLSCCAAALVLFPATISTAPARAQGADPAKKPDPPAPTQKTSASKSANVKNGVIAAIDSASDTLTVRDRTGKTAVYVITPKTHYNKNKRPSQLTDFKVGDSVILHVRRSRTDGALLVSELDD